MNEEKENWEVEWEAEKRRDAEDRELQGFIREYKNAELEERPELMRGVDDGSSWPTIEWASDIQRRLLFPYDGEVTSNTVVSASTVIRAYIALVKATREKHAIVKRGLTRE